MLMRTKMLMRTMMRVVLLLYSHVLYYINILTQSIVTTALGGRYYFNSSFTDEVWSREFKLLAQGHTYGREPILGSLPLTTPHTQESYSFCGRCCSFTGARGGGGWTQPCYVSGPGGVLGPQCSGPSGEGCAECCGVTWEEKPPVRLRGPACVPAVVPPRMHAVVVEQMVSLVTRKLPYPCLLWAKHAL